MGLFDEEENEWPPNLTESEILIATSIMPVEWQTTYSNWKNQAYAYLGEGVYAELWHIDPVHSHLLLSFNPEPTSDGTFFKFAEEKGIEATILAGLKAIVENPDWWDWGAVDDPFQVVEARKEFVINLVNQWLSSQRPN